MTHASTTTPEVFAAINLDKKLRYLEDEFALG
jgi:hypothetical protein